MSTRKDAGTIHGVERILRNGMDPLPIPKWHREPIVRIPRSPERKPYRREHETGRTGRHPGVALGQFGVAFEPRADQLETRDAQRETGRRIFPKRRSRTSENPLLLRGSQIQRRKQAIRPSKPTERTSGIRKHRSVFRIQEPSSKAYDRGYLTSSGDGFAIVQYS